MRGACTSKGGLANFPDRSRAFLASAIDLPSPSMKTITRSSSMTSTAVASKRLLRIVTGFVLAAFFLAIDSVPGRAQLSTDDHLAEPGWWPRRKPADLKEFAGNAACARCHSRLTTSQEATPMARTLMRAADADVLRSHSGMSFRNGKYLYRSRGRMPPLNSSLQMVNARSLRIWSGPLERENWGNLIFFSRTELTVKAG